MTEKEEQHDADQSHAEQQILEHGVRRDLHEVAAVVIDLDGHPRRKAVLGLHLLHLPVDALQRRGRLSAVAHEHNPLHHVVDVVLADHAAARRVAQVHVGHLVHAHGSPVLLRHDDAFDVMNVAQKANAANVIRLLADEEPLPTDVGIRVLNRRDELSERRLVTLERIRVNAHLVLLRLAAKAGDVDDARHLLELPFERPVLLRLHVAQRVARPDDRIAVHLTDCVPRRQLRLVVVGQLDELQAIDDFLPRVFVLGPPFEVALDVRQPEERLRSNVVEPDHPRQLHFERHRDVPLDLVCAPPVRLRDDFDQWRDGVRVGLDVELGKRGNAGGDEHTDGAQNEQRRPQREGHESFDHEPARAKHGTCHSNRRQMGALFTS